MNGAHIGPIGLEDDRKLSGENDYVVSGPSAGRKFRTAHSARYRAAGHARVADQPQPFAPIRQRYSHPIVAAARAVISATS